MNVQANYGILKATKAVPSYDYNTDNKAWYNLT